VDELYSKTELALALLEWAEKKAALDWIEADIIETVMARGSSIEVGCALAKFTAGRKTYQYKQAATESLDVMPTDEAAELFDMHTVNVPKTDWRALVIDGLGLDQKEVPFEQSSASVKLVLLDE